MAEKIVGILGGMGPESTADFFLKLIKATPASKDQEHLRILVDNNPKIPDRTLALTRDGDSPLPGILATLHHLERAGAEIIAIPCNTAHYYYGAIQSASNVPVVNMIAETASYIYRIFPEINKAGLLATTGTCKAGMYHQALSRLELITPNEEDQDLVMHVIYGEQGIKAGNAGRNNCESMTRVAQSIVARGAEVIVIGCTEISLALDQSAMDVPVVNPLDILARVIVGEAKGGERRDEWVLE